MRQRNTVASTAGSIVRGSCTAAESVGDPVYLTGDPSGYVYPVEKAEAWDEDKMPAFGIVIRKLSDTVCLVQTDGILPHGILSGLQRGHGYMVGGTGGLEAAPPVVGPNGYSWIQFMGRSLGDDRFQVRPDTLITIRRS